MRRLTQLMRSKIGHDNSKVHVQCLWRIVNMYGGTWVTWLSISSVLYCIIFADSNLKYSPAVPKCVPLATSLPVNSRSSPDSDPPASVSHQVDDLLPLQDDVTSPLLADIIQLSRSLLSGARDLSYSKVGNNSALPVGIFELMTPSYMYLEILMKTSLMSPVHLFHILYNLQPTTKFRFYNLTLCNTFHFCKEV